MTYRIQLPFKQQFIYTWAKPAGTYLTIYPEQSVVEDYKQWCKDSIGSNNWNYYGYYKKIPYEFKFKYEEDLLAFKIRFGL